VKSVVLFFESEIWLPRLGHCICCSARNSRGRLCSIDIAEMTVPIRYAANRFSQRVCNSEFETALANSNLKLVEHDAGWICE
jgi:hypothetical protein